MYKILLALVFTTISAASFGQKVHYIVPTDEVIEIPSRDFYIGAVIDERYSKENLGWIKEGLFNSRTPVDFENSFSYTLEEYFEKTLPQEKGQTPVKLIFKVLKVNEAIDAEEPTVSADIRVEFYYNDTQLFWTDDHLENTGNDIHHLLQATLGEILARSIKKFAASNFREKVEKEKPEKAVDNKFENPDAVHVTRDLDKNEEENKPITYSEEELKKMVPENKNVFALGFGLGGHSFIGVNYEVRLTDLFGIHGGAGYYGFINGDNYFTYTGGVKIHTKADKNSSFFNVSYKDLGFGVLGSVGVEFGDRVVFSEKADFGMVYQAGLAVITNVEEGVIYDGLPVGITAGIGLSFSIRKKH